MPITMKPHSSTQVDTQKSYLVTLYTDRHVAWEFCMTTLMKVFHMNAERATLMTDEIQTNGEVMCGSYTLEIAETKATLVEELAKKQNFVLQCLVEEV